MTFTELQNHKHREAFINECRQKAWGASCHADWVSKGLDTIMAEYAKIKEEDDKLAGDIKTLENAVDYHTVENREKRKGMQERRNQLVKVQNAIAENLRHGTESLENFWRNFGTMR